MEELAVVRESGATGSTAIIRLKGSLTIASAPLLRETLGKLPGDTVIDVSAVRYIDSSGLGTILSHWSHTQRTGYKFALTGANPRINMLLKLAGVDTVFLMFKTAEEADGSFIGPTAERR